MVNFYSTVKEISKTFKLLNDFKNLSNLGISPAKSKVSFNRLLEVHETNSLLELGIPIENINGKLTLLGYTIDMLSASDSDTIKETINTCKDKLKKNIKK